MATLQLQGELTIGEAAAHRELLLTAMPANGGELALDLADVHACDSAGIQLLLATQRLAVERGTAMTWGPLPACIADALATYGVPIDALFTKGQA